MDLLASEPQPMRCTACGATWFSRVAGIVVRSAGLGRCAFCGGRLELVEGSDASAPDPEPA